MLWLRYAIYKQKPATTESRVQELQSSNQQQPRQDGSVRLTAIPERRKTWQTIAHKPKQYRDASISRIKPDVP